MTSRQLAEVCAKITMNLLAGGVPLELAMVGVKMKLAELMVEHKNVADTEAKYDTIATELNPYVTAPYIEIGATYIISYVGNTDFTLLGASSNTLL